MKRVGFLVILVVVAALAAATALAIVIGHDGGRADSSAFGNSTQIVENIPLTKLSEATTQSSPDASVSQTDNGTVPVTSGGAVKASFTVVTPPVRDQGENGVLSTSSVARDPNSTSATAPAQEVNGVALDNQPTQNDRLGAAADARPKSGGLTMGWVLLITVWAVEVAAVCCLAFLRVWARE